MCLPDSRARAKRTRAARLSLCRRPRLRLAGPAAVRRLRVLPRLESGAGNRHAIPCAGFAANEGSAVREAALRIEPRAGGQVATPCPPGPRARAWELRRRCSWPAASVFAARRAGARAVAARAGVVSKVARARNRRSARVIARGRLRQDAHEQLGPVSQNGGWPPARRRPQRRLSAPTPAELPSAAERGIRSRLGAPATLPDEVCAHGRLRARGRNGRYSHVPSAQIGGEPTSRS
jgi:hypothetical protein